jgi:hypothetical protein
MEIAPGLMAWCALGAEGVSKDLKDKMLLINSMMGPLYQSIRIVRKERSFSILKRPDF